MELKAYMRYITSFMGGTFLAYFGAIAIVVICTIVNFAIYQRIDHSNLIMLYLLGVVFVASMSVDRRGPAMLAAFLSTMAFDFFFIPPRFSFTVSNIQYLFTLVVMMLVAQLISQLTIGIRRYTLAAREAQFQAESERLRNTLLTSISHDFRTPLTAIMGSASSLMLPGKALTEEMRYELAKNIYDESESLNRLVNNILQTIRLEAGSMRMNIHVHSLEEVIRTVRHKFEKRLSGRNIKVRIVNQLPYISFDNVLIEQVMINLIENAIKFSPADSPIEISAMRQNSIILVKITDYGCGVSNDALAQIFDKFHRRCKPESNGVGLGLAICKGIIHFHGGKIWAENNGNKGMTFSFTLPIGKITDVEE